jgi:hypothetical protein
MPRPYHSPRLHNSNYYYIYYYYFNYTWQRVQVRKLLIMQFSSSSCHLISPRSKYSPQHPVLKHPPSMYLS